MKIGIPKAFLYYRYRYLWETFFNELGCDIVLSEDTNKKMLTIGSNHAIDEACLSYKVYLGHVESLIGRCDYILVPRICNYKEREMVCTRFQAVYDVVNNTFKERDIKLLDYDIDVCLGKTEEKGFLEMGKRLGKSKKETLKAYYMAKQAEKTHNEIELEEQNKKLNQEGMKLLIVSHPYNIKDAYIGKPIIDYIEELGCIPILAHIVPREKANLKALEIAPTLQWTYSKELVGAIELYKDQIDGIILMTSFPCGPDSLVNEIIIRKIKGKPIVSLILDMQDGTAGRETRLESFVDIIKMKKEEQAHAKSQN